MVIHDLSDTELDQLAIDLMQRVNPSRASDALNEKYWQLRAAQDLKLPSYFDTLLDDTLLAFGPEPMCDALLGMRINTILLSAVAAAKIIHPQTHVSDMRCDIFGDQVRLCLEQVVTMRRLNDKEYNHVRCTAQGILWFGDERHLDAILVVEKTTSVIGKDTPRLPAIMLMLHHSRALVGVKSDMYGIVTNSYQWLFTRMTGSGQYFQTLLDWTNMEERHLILSHIGDIVEQAVVLVKDTEPPFFDVSYRAECAVWPDKLASEKLDPSDDEEEDMGILVDDQCPSGLHIPRD